MRKNNRNKEKRVIITDIKKMLKDDAPLRIKEAYSLVRAKLLFTAKGEKCPVYVITSSGSDEGKTINSINMAISFAMAGKKTLLIDADLRNPTVHKYFRLSPSPGLSEVLAKIQGKINIVKTEQENLFFLRAGEIPPNPAELLGSAAFGEMLEHLEEKFDCIFIDMPPMGIVADAAVVNGYVTAYILVVRSMETEYNEIQWTVDKFRSFNANLAGFLLNDVGGSGGKYSEYGYYGYYGTT
ncbi:CpsD/CapB family tyrosine-protein kinase [Mediterraneibacter glycyrrhizinilyticus]|uniref:CpsD/CapB family tyrosine-protein kinase n=1 Tax=Mediterraneibacter glycyrrhizinilyticus TaxID=342942 RepID=UPI0025AA9B25|nr:CpsD/CapB family tyrosine-protein kinase [Mediterraneibacter glycyrrhizinilyticus]MDN0043143.1 CpsD/CapB family tyrosine-protein kinase [Mediterraneibacter glycyrrhizinilyticus]